MTKKLIFVCLCVFTIFVSCSQKTENSDNTSSDTNKLVSDPKLDKFKKFIDVSSATSDTISKYYNIYAQIIGQSEVYPIKIGAKQFIGATKNNAFKFKIWLSELDNSGNETGYESNTIPISFGKDEYEKQPTAHIELQGLKISSGIAILETKATKPPSDQIIISAGHPFN